MSTEKDIAERLRDAYSRTGGNAVGDPFVSQIAREIAAVREVVEAARLDDEMTPERLAEIKARADAATPGPWEFDELPFRYKVRTPQRHRAAIIVHAGDTVHNIPNYGSPAMGRADAAFIAEARSDVPALIAALEAAEARAAAAEAKLAEAYDAGFATSGEGWNGEYPGDAHTSDYYRQKRDAFLASLDKETTP